MKSADLILQISYCKFNMCAVKRCDFKIFTLLPTEPVCKMGKFEYPGNTNTDSNVSQEITDGTGA